MNPLDRFRLWVARGMIKASNVSFMPEWLRYSVFHPTFQALLSEGYKANSAIFACVTALAFGFSEPSLMVWAGEGKDLEPIRNHPVRRLMRRPNPDMGEAEFHATCVTYCSIGGNVYIWKQRNAAGKPIALWPFHDGQIFPVPGRNTQEGLVAYYSLDIGNGASGNPFNVPGYDASVSGVAIPKQDIIHWKWMPDPAQPSRGIGAIAAAARDVDTDNEVGNYVFSLLKNDAMPRAIITLVEGEELTEARANILRTQWMQKHGGANRGVPAFLEAGMKAEKMSFDLQQLAFETLRAVPEARICATFRVPPIIAGLNIGLNRSTFSNYAEARQSFTEDTLVRLWRFFASEMESALSEDFGSELILQHDLSMVRALQENEGAIWQRADAAINNGWITRAEARQMVGLPSLPTDDVYKEGFAFMWVPVGETRPELLPDETPQDDEATSNNQGDNPKALPPGNTKAKRRITRQEREFLQKAVDAQRNIRLFTAGRMEAALDGYFKELADRVVARAMDAVKSSPVLVTANGHGEAKNLSRADWRRIVEMIHQQRDVADLEIIVKRFYLEILINSSGIFDLILGTQSQFDENDPLVTRLLKEASQRVKDISETTRQEINELLQFGNDNGWSIDQLVRGDNATGKRGLRDLVVETYKGRAKTIARTELGAAQNLAAHGRYIAAGVKQVLVFDNGLTDDDEPCKEANGAIWTIEQMQANPLEHPNCTRAFGPLFD